MCGEKAAAIFPKPRPDLFAIGLWNLERIDFGSRKKLKPSFAASLRKRGKLLLYLKQKHQPVCPALETVFTHHAGQMQIRRCKRHTNLLLRFAAGAGVRRFPDVHFQFPAARTPKATVRFLGTLQQEDVIALIEAIKQGGDFVGQNHRRFLHAQLWANGPIHTSLGQRPRSTGTGNERQRRGLWQIKLFVGSARIYEAGFQPSEGI
jgi:hypothetical protein